MSKICKVCSNLGDTIDCSQCKNVSYCSENCLNIDLPQHKIICQYTISKTYEGILHITTSIKTNEQKFEFHEKDEAVEEDKNKIVSLVGPIFKSMVTKYNGFPNVACGEYININDKDVGYVRILSSFPIKDADEHFNTLEIRIFKNSDDYKKSEKDFNNNGLAGIEEFYHLITKDYEVKFQISTNKETSTINIKQISASEPENKNLGLEVINYAFQNFMGQLESAADGEIIKLSVKKGIDIIHITKKVITDSKFEFTVNVFFGIELNQRDIELNQRDIELNQRDIDDSKEIDL